MYFSEGKYFEGLFLNTSWENILLKGCLQTAGGTFEQRDAAKGKKRERRGRGCGEEAGKKWRRKLGGFREKSCLFLGCTLYSVAGELYFWLVWDFPPPLCFSADLTKPCTPPSSFPMEHRLLGPPGPHTSSRQQEEEEGDEEGAKPPLLLPSPQQGSDWVPVGWPRPNGVPSLALGGGSSRAGGRADPLPPHLHSCDCRASAQLVSITNPSHPVRIKQLLAAALGGCFSWVLLCCHQTLLPGAPPEVRGWECL